MEFVADVHVNQTYITALRNEGYSIGRVVDIDQLGQTATDAEILAYASDQDATILTNDAKDFDTESDTAVIIVPQRGLTPGEIAAAITRIDRTIPNISGCVLYVTAWA